VTTAKGEVCFSQRIRNVILIVSIILTEFGYGQLIELNSLGVVQKFPLPFSIQFSSLLNYSSSQYPDLLYYSSDSSEIGILKNDGNGVFSNPKIVAQTNNATSFTVGNINNDGIDDIVVVHRDLNQIEIIMSKKSDSSYFSTHISVNFYPEKVVIGDINNDMIPDIISFGKLSTGICVVQGKGNEKFHPKITLFKDIPVSDFSIVALNADNISDAAVYNWLSNETILFLGFGKMKFSEQTVLSFGQDSVHTMFEDFNNDGLADVAVSSVQNKTIQILHGDGLGNFSIVQTISTVLAPDKIVKESFNKINSSDILLNSNSANMLSIMINNGDGNFYDEIVFGKDLSASETIVGDINADGLADIIVIEKDLFRYTVFWNSQTKFLSFQNEQSFAVGLKPINLSVVDLNNDGLDDIAVSNFESSTVSFLFSKKYSFHSQMSIEVPEKPYSVSFYSKSDSAITFYTTHQESPQISLFTLRRGADSSYLFGSDIEQFSIPLPEKPITVLPDVSFMHQGISLYAFMGTSTNAIIFYQQLKGTRFIAKNLVSNLQSKVLYATISDLNNDGKTDLLYVYNDENIKSCIFGVSMNDSIGSFKGKILRYMISDSIVRKAFIYFEDMNGDQIKDCIMYTSPNNALRISFGSKENIFGQFEQFEDNVKIRIPGQLQILDYDNDGVNDIVFMDTDNFDIFIVRGKNNGKYFPRIKYKTLPRESVFRSGDFNGDSITDIAYTNPAESKVTIVYGKKN